MSTNTQALAKQSGICAKKGATMSKQESPDSSDGSENETCGGMAKDMKM